jgi:hypothetical protein
MQISENIEGVFSLLIYNDKLIVSDADEEFLYKIADLKSDKILSRIIKRGNGPCEFQLPTSIQKIPGHPDMLGLTNRKFFDFSWSKFNDLNLEINCISKTKRFNYNFQNFILVNPKDSLFIGYGLFNDRFVVSNKEGEILYSFSDYPFRDQFPEVHFNFLAMAYQGDIRPHPNSSKFVFTNWNSANMEIHEVGIHQSTPIMEYKFWPPKFTFKKDNPQVISVDFEKDNEFGFLSTAVNEKQIFTLYSGKAGKEASRGNRVFVFDWEGLPIKSLKLDQEVKYIAVDETGDFLYAYAENGKPQILRFSLR